MFAESVFDERDQELWLEFAEPSSCDSFDKLPHDRDNYALDELVNDNNCRGHRLVAFLVARGRMSIKPCVDAAVADWATVVVVAVLRFVVVVESSVKFRMHRTLAKLLTALDLDLQTGQIASIINFLHDKKFYILFKKKVE